VQPSYNWGRPTDVPGVFVLGGEDWEIAWSPMNIHPYAAQWIEWSSRFGPPGRMAPPGEMWAFTLQTRDLAD